MWVVRKGAVDETPEGATGSITLAPLDEGGKRVAFYTFRSVGEAQASGGDVFERCVEVRGMWPDDPRYAVYADWEVVDASRASLFEESRRSLFEVRRTHLATFALDWLLKRVDSQGLYTVLGLYGDEDGAARLCREHPEVVRYAQSHPLPEGTARDVSGMRVFRVEQAALTG